MGSTLTRSPLLPLCGVCDLPNPRTSISFCGVALARVCI